MVSIALVSLVVVTSVAAYVCGVLLLKLPAALIRDAGRRTLESIGLTAVFFGLNLLGWIVAVLGARTIFGWFVSVYFFNGVTIGILSLLQGLMFQRWWESGQALRMRAS